MSGVIVKYKDNTIANIADTGSKTLKTGGKYCEGDITVEYEKPPTGTTVSGTKEITANGNYDVAQYANANVNVPTGITPSGTKTITTNGTHDVSAFANALVNVPIPDVPNVKMWVHTQASDGGNSPITVVSGDADIAKHYADKDAFALYLFVGETIPTGRPFGFACNKLISSSTTKYGLITMGNSTSNYNSSYPLDGSLTGTGMWAMTATANGGLQISSTTSYKLKAGTYLVVFGWN